MTRDPTSFRYERDLSGRINGRSFYWRMPADIRTKEELFAAVADGLWFPAAPDLGWTELLDGLCGLDDLPDRKVVIVHEVLPRLPETELRAYLAVLNDAVRWWRGEAAHELEIVFPDTERFRIARLMREA